MSYGKNDIDPEHYWKGEGRKLLVIPPKVIRQTAAANPLLTNLYIKELGHYPAADKHYTNRKNGCPEMVVMLCTKGRGSFTVSSEKHTILPGQYFILFPDEPHEYEADIIDPWSIYWFKIGGAFISGFCKKAIINNYNRPVYAKELVEIRRLFEDLITMLENGYSIDRILYANMTVQRILAILLYSSEETSKETKKLSNNVIKLLRDNIAEKFALAELADQFSYSTSQFSNIFKKETGYSPIDYFIQLKIQEACRLLHHTDLRIYEVALQVGYTDPYHFSKTFKIIMDISPEQYRIIFKK
ncbi:transcriptional regulator, AraC family [Pedobacter westerhofensis]|uniref:Transcriptional regulator, AraC family n=1 Tax=Pedobacter westerhofensis TaxID=425512 RepID=A0A521FRR8_9SPHI|nr:AraC family transcriptional regulator [Pedobacter westerhofensis]SMO98898.1 transcriptional regulator, AraC family [Pedobacter westerhofensis]